MHRCTYSLPSPDTGAQVALAASIACDAMADPIELTEFFDVDVDQFVGMLPLVATCRLGRSQGSQPVEAEPTQNGGRLLAISAAIFFPA